MASLPPVAVAEATTTKATMESVTPMPATTTSSVVSVASSSSSSTIVPAPTSSVVPMALSSTPSLPYMAWRRAEVDDIPELLSIRDLVVTPFIDETLVDTKRIDHGMALYLPRINDPTYTIIIAEWHTTPPPPPVSSSGYKYRFRHGDGIEIVGYARGQRPIPAHTQVCNGTITADSECVHLFIRPQWQRRGIGDTLWSLMIRHMLPSLTPSPSNLLVWSMAAAVPWYEARGGKKVDEKPATQEVAFMWYAPFDDLMARANRLPSSLPYTSIIANAPPFAPLPLVAPLQSSLSLPYMVWRRATVDDCLELLSIQGMSLSDTHIDDTITEPHEIPGQLARWQPRLSDPDMIFMVAEWHTTPPSSPPTSGEQYRFRHGEGIEIVGWIRGQRPIPVHTAVFKDERKLDCEVMNIHIRPSWQRRRIGERLWALMWRQLLSQFTPSNVLVWSVATAVEWYRRRGGTPVMQHVWTEGIAPHTAFIWHIADEIKQQRLSKLNELPLLPHPTMITGPTPPISSPTPIPVSAPVPATPVPVDSKDALATPSAPASTTVSDVSGAAAAPSPTPTTTNETGVVTTDISADANAAITTSIAAV